MNSKEALTILINANLGDKKSKKLLSSQYGVIVKQLFNDLEVLEIIKNHILNVGIDISGICLKKHYNGLNEPYYTIEIKEGIKKIVSTEEFNKLKEWLENE